MDKKIWIIGGGLLALILGLLYMFWPKSLTGIKGGNGINLSYQQGIANQIIVDGKAGSYQIINGQKVFIPSDVELVNLSPREAGKYSYLAYSSVGIDDSSVISIKGKGPNKASFNVSENPENKFKNASFGGGGGGGGGSTFPLSGNSTCLSTLTWMGEYNVSQKIYSLSYETIFNFAVMQLYNIRGFGGLSAKNQADIAAKVAEILNDKRGLTASEIKEICSQIESPAKSVTNLVYESCIVALNDILDARNTSTTYISEQLKTRVEAFGAIPPNGQKELVGKISHDLYNYMQNNGSFNPSYYCALMSNYTLGALDDTDVFKQCIAILKTIEADYKKNTASITNDYVMSKLMDIPGFAFVAESVRSKIVSDIKLDLADGGAFNIEVHCLNITAAIFDALKNTEMYKQCIAALTAISKMPNPSVLNIENQLNTISGFAFLDSTKKEQLINEIIADIKNGGDFNIELHCFNITTAILDAIGNSDIYKKCLITMDAIAAAYNSQNGTASFDPVAFKTDVILKKLFDIPGFSILSEDLKTKHVNTIYDDLANGGEFNKFLICTNLALDIMEAISNSDLYKQCIAVMDSIYASGKTDFDYIKSMLSTLPGFSLLPLTKQDSFSKEVQDDLLDGGAFEKEQHCLNIVAAIIDNLANNKLYQQCIAILTDVYNDYQKNPRPYEEEFSYIQQKLSALSGFSLIEQSKQKALIDPIVVDLMDKNTTFFDKELYCINIVSAILDANNDKSNLASCVTDISALVTQGNITDESSVKKVLNKYFIDDQAFIASQTSKAIVYNGTDDKTIFATSICSQKSNNSNGFNLVDCINYISTAFLTKKMDILNAGDKPGFVNGLLLQNILNYQSNDTTVSLALNFAMLDKGTPQEVCVVGNSSLVSQNNSSSNSSTGDDSTDTSCVMVINDIYKNANASSADAPYVQSKLNTINQFTTLSASAKASVIQVILNSIKTGTYSDPVEICQDAFSNPDASDMKNDSFASDVGDEANCKAIISYAQEEYLKYTQDSAANTSTSATVLQMNDDKLQKDIVERIIKKVDDETHLVTDSKVSYATNLFEVHVADIGNALTSKSIKVINAQSRSNFAQNVYRNLSKIKEFSTSYKKYIVKEIAKCDNPLRGFTRIQDVFAFVDAKDKGLLQTDNQVTFNNPNALMNYTRNISPAYPQCMDVVKSFTPSVMSAADAAAKIKQSVSGADSEKISGFVDFKVGENIACFYRPCPESGSFPINCSSYNTPNCEARQTPAVKNAFATSICDDLVSTVTISVPLAAMQNVTIDNYSVCEPADSEFATLSATVQAGLKKYFVDNIVAIASHNISATSIEAASYSNDIDRYSDLNAMRLHYITLLNIFGSIDTSAIIIGTEANANFRFDDIIVKAGDSSDKYISYSDFLLNYATQYGMITQQGNSVIKNIESITNSEAYLSCNALIDSVANSVNSTNIETIRAYIEAQKGKDLFTGYSILKITNPSEYLSITTNLATCASYKSITSSATLSSQPVNNGSSSSSSGTVSNSCSNPCTDLATRIFQKFNSTLSGITSGISGDVMINGSVKSIGSMSVSDIASAVANYIKTTTKKDLKTSDITSDDINWDLLTTNATEDSTTEAARFKQTKLTDIFNAGLSDVPQARFVTMTYKQKKDIVEETQNKIALQTLESIDSFEAEASIRVCRAVYDVWKAVKEGGGIVSESKCNSVLSNAWSDGVCDMTPEFKRLCLGELDANAGLRRASDGKYCVETELSVLTKEMESKRSFYQRQLPAPTNKCKCYLEAIYNTTKNKQIDNFASCKSIVDSIQKVYDQYGESVVNGVKRSSCQLVFSMVKTIVQDDQYSEINMNAANNDDYDTIAARVCNQNLRDLHGLVEYTRSSYWMETNISSIDGSTLKPSEYTKWSGVTTDNLDVCKAEDEVYI